MLFGAKVGAANWSEVLTYLVRNGWSAEDALASMQALNLEIVPVDRAQAEWAGEMWPVCRSTGLSLGDRLCLALAHEHGAEVYTADRIWTDVADALNVTLIVIR